MKHYGPLSAALPVIACGLLAACGESGGESKIAFARGSQPLFETARTDIYVMNADGSGQRRLTRNPKWDGYPA